jgi:biotin synthase-like enzyme
VTTNRLKATLFFSTPSSLSKSIIDITWTHLTSPHLKVNGLGLEVCCTLGMLTKDQALQLKEAGLTAYNHNLDTSREFYPQVHTITAIWLNVMNS